MPSPPRNGPGSRVPPGDDQRMNTTMSPEADDRHSAKSPRPSRLTSQRRWASFTRRLGTNPPQPPQDPLARSGSSPHPRGGRTTRGKGGSHAAPPQQPPPQESEPRRHGATPTTPPPRTPVQSKPGGGRHESKSTGNPPEPAPLHHRLPPSRAPPGGAPPSHSPATTTATRSREHGSPPAGGSPVPFRRRAFPSSEPDPPARAGPREPFRGPPPATPRGRRTSVHLHAEAPLHDRLRPA